MRRCCRNSSLLMTAIALLLLGAEASAAEDDRDSNQHRYERRDPLSLTVPRRPVTRKDYVDFVRPWAEHYEMTPEADQWNWRTGPLRIMPPLAVFALEGDHELGNQIKGNLRTFAQWVDQSIAKKGAVFCLDAAAFCTLCVQELRKRGLMTPEDDRWVREMFLNIRKHHPAWAENGPWDGWWRGSQHRAQAQGINNALAAFLYPDEPGAAEWRRIAKVIWGDWWNFRDVGINDTWYYHSSLGNITRAAHILGRKEVFTDPQSRQLFERVLFETTPEGGEVPYGASCGYNVVAGSRIVALELAARYTGDGRYRWAAHRLMNNCQSRDFCRNSPQGTKGIADIAVASLVCDDSIQPVKPEPDSKLLTRKEITRGPNPFPDWGGLDCGMYMTGRVMPSKLAFRSGWEPGDLFMLVECYARHDPLNPTAIVGLERYGASMAEMVSEKFLCRENAVAIRDLSGTANYLGKKNYQGPRQLPTGWAGMESTVPVFLDRKLATHARVDVTHYMGYEATQRREFLFVKNGFVLVRDETSLDDAFRAEIGPTWNTQHVGEVRGNHWINTWFSAHCSIQNQELGLTKPFFVHKKLFDVPPWDLLVWYAPREGTQLKIIPDSADKAQVASGMFPTRYAWEGNVEPGTKLQFVTVLLPHAPTRDASTLASGITVLVDRPGLVAVRITQENRCELAMLNPEGTTLELDAAAGGHVSTDGRAAYLDFDGGHLRRALVLQGTTLKLGAEQPFRSPDRQDFETGH